MPCLMIFYYKSIQIEKGKSNAIHRWMLGALLLSFLGDCFLLIKGAKMLFILGLSSFLLAHICYIFAFKRDINKISKEQLLRDNLLIKISVLLFGSTLIVVLFSFGNEGFATMKVPVSVYALVIMTMAFTAALRKSFVNAQSYLLVLIGACLFVFSDSVIALNKFTALFENNNYLPRFLIMSTYGVAQYLIVKGILLQQELSA